MKTIAALAAAAAALGAAGTASAADFVRIPLETTVNAPADVAWKKISGYCAIGAWFKTTCEITSGKDGEVGAVRVIAGRITELLVASTAWSYTYSQPKSPIDYHGTLEIRPIDKKTSKLLYTLVYDAAALPDPSKKDADIANRTKQFTGLLATIKAQAEAK
ncbi:SRPBCC family protein [Phenylobacterium sp.]|uniref:SRPBCC family protein n=1 Tax=Phenylobacterium sp. TaxID=1871053 RepID=UPI001215AD20|nr:SRPBCC family protein [Phenylobacterium sp.]TAL34679.1 MAG: SRPBCC family protein [Phenylobacterium sp.]